MNEIIPTCDNGEMTDKEKAIRAGKTCGRCAKKFPPHLPLSIEMPPQSNIAQPGQKPGVAVCICQNPKSDEFQRVLNIFCGCKHCQVIKEQVAERMKI